MQMYGLKHLIIFDPYSLLINSAVQLYPSNIQTRLLIVMTRRKLLSNFIGERWWCLFIEKWTSDKTKSAAREFY
jgi:hypothetical protein